MEALAEINEKRLVEEFISMVQIDSVSGKERKLADYLKKELEHMGLNVWEDTTGKTLNTTTGNLIARLPGTQSGEPLLLCAHMDTVEPGTNVKPILSEGIIRSAGDTILGADDKGGIAVILEALRVFIANQIPHSGIEIVFTVWEEGGLFGSKNLQMNGLEARYGYALDSDGPPGTVIIQAPFQDTISACIRGKAAHAGTSPEEGINAIVVASKAIAAMKLGRLDAETTANIGIINGGKATNIVPDSVLIEGEARSLQKAKKEAQTHAMVQAIKNAASAYRTTADVVIENVYPGFHLKNDDKLLCIAVTAAKNLGLKPHLLKSGGGSDANIFNGKGITMANLGIGMKKMHTTEEYIQVQDLLNSARYLYEIIQVAQKDME